MASFTDNFNRANESLDASANWLELANSSTVGASNFSIVTNQVEIVSFASGGAHARCEQVMVSDDHSAQFTLTARTGGYYEIGVRVTNNAAHEEASSYYGFGHNQGQAKWQIQKHVNGTITDVGTFSETSPGTPVTLKLEARTVGTDVELKGYGNGILKVTATDSVSVISGSNNRKTMVRNLSSSQKWDDFSAADLAAAVAVGQATETDTALAVGKTKVYSLGLAEETDTALAVLTSNVVAVGQATETDTALVAEPAKAVVLGIATETDSALLVKTPTRVTVGMAFETDTAQTLSAVQPIWIFIPPTADRWTFAEGQSLTRSQRRFWSHFGSQPRGRSVLKVGGNYSTVDTPSQSQLDTCDLGKWPDGTTSPVFYLGGHQYRITSAERSRLVTAGYGAFITLEAA